MTIADKGALEAVTAHPELRAGVNIVGDSVCHPAVATSLGTDHIDPVAVLGA